MITARETSKGRQDRVCTWVDLEVAGLVAKEVVVLAADCTTCMDLNSGHITSLHAISPTCVSGSRGQIRGNRVWEQVLFYFTTMGRAYLWKCRERGAFFQGDCKDLIEVGAVIRRVRCGRVRHLGGDGGGGAGGEGGGEAGGGLHSMRHSISHS